uniref:Uncharacterized protein n=1 Tax=Rhinella marina erythrocytic-like virus TaxID=2859906 RepID=A0A8F6UAX3_9VIRU|nr:hypothetical protein RMELV038 [Rhinella marina erythrocytic-like virus]
MTIGLKKIYTLIKMRLINSDVTISVNKTNVREHDRDFYIPLNSNYTLDINNKSDKTIDYRVSIDGTHVGTWRIYPKSSVSLERPVDKPYKFCFVDKDTIPELRNKKDTGVLVISEWVCKDPIEDLIWYEAGALETDGPCGATILADKSSQTFSHCPKLETTRIGEYTIGMKPSTAAPYMLL